MASIFDDYLAETPALAPFFAAPPRALLGGAPATAPWAEGMVEILSAQQNRLGLERTFSGNECVIITGQQPGLFTGPLFTVYKAITAILVAGRLQARSGVPCVPVFWVGSDDHDFEEVRCAHLLTRQHEKLTLCYTPGEADGLALHTAGLAMHCMPAAASIHGLIDNAAIEARASELLEEVRSVLHLTLECATSLADWFALVMGWLFQDTPLIVFQPHTPEVRRIARPIFEREITHPLESTRLLNEAGQRLATLGYAPQLVKAPEECNFFLEMGGRRRKVIYESGAFVLPEENMVCGQDDLLELLQHAPERFSPNVALRCMVQQSLFQPAAYVAGPGEIAYWAQFKPVFEFFELPMPTVYPRARAIILPAKEKALLKRYDFTLDDLMRPEDALVDEALRRTFKSPALDALRDRRTAVESAMDDLVTAVENAARDAQVRETLRQWRAHTASGLDRAERALMRANTAQSDAARKQIRRLCSVLAPDRKPQERVYSIVSFLFEYGGELIPKLMQALDAESFTVNEVEL